MSAALEAFQQSFPVFALWTGTAAALLIAATAIYVLLTPWKELTLLKEGNGSAGLALAGAIVGLAIPLASCLASSISIGELVLWGIVSLLIQLLAFRIVQLLIPDIPTRIKNDEAGIAVVLVAAKLASAMLLAAGLWDPELQRF